MTVSSLIRKSTYLERPSLYWDGAVAPLVAKSSVAIASLWRYQMETFSALLAICVGNSPVTRELPTQRPVTRSFDVFFDMHLNKQLNKQSQDWWFETQSCSLWRHGKDIQHKHVLVNGKWFKRPASHLMFLQNNSTLRTPVRRRHYQMSLSWMKTFEFPIEFYWYMFLVVKLTMSQYWSR